MNKPKIVGIGELLWDVMPSGKRIGGAPLNFAFYAAQADADAAVVSAIGYDLLGDELAKDITGLGVDVSAVSRNNYPTSTVKVKFAKMGVPTYVISEGVAWDYLFPTQIALAKVQQADAICWGSLAQRSPISQKTILQLVDITSKKTLRIFDINLRLQYYTRELIEQSIRRCNILKLNEEELPIVCNLFKIVNNSIDVQIQKLLHMFSLQFVVYTRGADYSEVVGKDFYSVIPTPKRNVIDTVGAGDSFTATFTTELLYGYSPKICHQRAVDVAACVCMHNGAIAPITTKFK